MPTIGERLQHAWNAFRGRDRPYENYGYSSSVRPDRSRFTRGNDKTVITAIYNRIALDVASIKLMHVRVDQNGRYLSDIPSGLNECLTVMANIDQTAFALTHDLVISMFDEGVVAVVPVDTTIDPTKSASYQINSLRVGKIVQWYPKHVRVLLYNDETGQKEEITLPKSMVAIIENPFYSIMNEPNSTMQRLVRKLELLDMVDEQTRSNKLNMIIQLPYVIRTKTRKDQAEERRKDIEDQLVNSKYGIAYTDGTEKITQISRPLENNLLSQIEFLTNQLYSQLGITPEIMNGTANEQVMLNYYTRIVEVVVSAIADAYRSKFLTKTARTQGQSIIYMREPFRLVPVNNIADIADKFTRNEILSTNEVRGIIGFKPVNDERADELRNKNINQSPDQEMGPIAGAEENQNGVPEEEQYMEEPQYEEELPPEEYQEGGY